ncbi:MAG TPA: NAD-dependent epimerase/dehydratase family protein [Candidatus Krumholzibacteria bacterium]|nr:NAD-dependent epimerase/dehydratase family protein [Candidatus Krumholzibacteria bacterium]
MKRVLVTGATGFLGRATCEALAGRAWVRATSRSIGGDGPWDEAMRADLGAPVQRALTDGVDTILHCAGVAHGHGVPIDDDEFFAAGNVTATRRLCQAAAAAGVARVVLAGSVAVLGDGGPFAIAEDAAPAPASGYARSKLAAERIVRETAAEPVVLRFPLVYGPGLPGNLARMIDAVERRRFPPVPEVHNRRSMIHVQDVGSAMALAGGSADAAGGTFTVTDGRAYSTREIYEWIIAALGRRIPHAAPPAALFQALARCGDLVGRAAGRRAPFDSDAWRKLFGSAEYAAARFNALGFNPIWDLARAMPAMVAARRSDSR